MLFITFLRQNVFVWEVSNVFRKSNVFMYVWFLFRLFKYIIYYIVSEWNQNIRIYIWHMQWVRMERWEVQQEFNDLWGDTPEGRRVALAPECFNDIFNLWQLFGEEPYIQILEQDCNGEVEEENWEMAEDVEWDWEGEEEWQDALTRGV